MRIGWAESLKYSARFKNFFVISTKGEIYPCEYVIGNKKYIIGNIKDNNVHIRDCIWSIPKIIDDCDKCVLLPICLGSCSAKRYIDKIDCQKEQQIQSIKQRLCKLAYTKQE